MNGAQIDRAAAELLLQPIDHSPLPTKSDITLKIWILALSAVAVIAARATYNLVNRPPRTGRFSNDQVSSDWLATARIHEDEG
jgi:hypothetical protein